MMSLILIGEKMNYHDVISSCICTMGVIALSNPMGWKDISYKELVGFGLAFVSAFSFNLSFIALRKIRNANVSSWFIVFLIMLLNILLLPPTVFVHN